MRRINEATAMRHAAALDWLALRLILVGPSIAPRWVIRLDADDINDIIRAGDCSRACPRDAPRR